MAWRQKISMLYQGTIPVAVSWWSAGVLAETAKATQIKPDSSERRFFRMAASASWKKPRIAASAVTVRLMANRSLRAH